MLYKTVYAVRQGSCVNNFAIETAEINIEVKHHLRCRCICHIICRSKYVSVTLQIELGNLLLG